MQMRQWVRVLHVGMGVADPACKDGEETDLQATASFSFFLLCICLFIYYCPGGTL
jgi:hypothetical protein